MSAPTRGARVPSRYSCLCRHCGRRWIADGYREVRCCLINRDAGEPLFIVMKAVRATVNDTPCDGRCTSATGPNCDCSCGGRNHGLGKVAAASPDWFEAKVTLDRPD